MKIVQIILCESYRFSAAVSKKKYLFFSVLHQIFFPKQKLMTIIIEKWDHPSLAFKNTLKYMVILIGGLKKKKKERKW